VIRLFPNSGGWLEVVCGPMFSGKSEELIRRLRRAEIAGFIRRVVENWDTETLVERIELQVGRDLQYIRINGTLVGGLVGLLIFAIAQQF